MFFKIYLVIITKKSSKISCFLTNEKVIILKKHIHFGKTLRFIRETFDYTQEFVSRHLNIERQTYSHYETGRNLPSVEILYHLANLYHIGVENFYLPLYDPRNDIAYQPETNTKDADETVPADSGKQTFSNNTKNCVLIAVPPEIAELTTILSSFSKDDLEQIKKELVNFQKKSTAT